MRQDVVRMKQEHDGNVAAAQAAKANSARLMLRLKHADEKVADFEARFRDLSLNTPLATLDAGGSGAGDNARLDATSQVLSRELRACESEISEARAARDAQAHAAREIDERLRFFGERCARSEESAARALEREQKALAERERGLTVAERDACASAEAIGALQAELTHTQAELVALRMELAAARNVLHERVSESARIGQQTPDWPAAAPAGPPAPSAAAGPVTGSAAAMPAACGAVGGGGEAWLGELFAPSDTLPLSGTPELPVGPRSAPMRSAAERGSETPPAAGERGERLGPAPVRLSSYDAVRLDAELLNVDAGSPPRPAAAQAQAAAHATNASDWRVKQKAPSQPQPATGGQRRLSNSGWRGAIAVTHPITQQARPGGAGGGGGGARAGGVTVAQSDCGNNKSVRDIRDMFTAQAPSDAVMGEAEQVMK
ncbi:hypothetical protein T492DRAFT_946143 [Pavlovales sp. CCMP2436]|nr:hypothetical protein T492DRAFT_946143 [Pavlovales sp. CCMP2436]